MEAAAKTKDAIFLLLDLGSPYLRAQISPFSKPWPEKKEKKLSGINGRLFSHLEAAVAAAAAAAAAAAVDTYCTSLSLSKRKSERANFFQLPFNYLSLPRFLPHSPKKRKKVTGQPDLKKLSSPPPSLWFSDFWQQKKKKVGKKE